MDEAEGSALTHSERRSMIVNRPRPVARFGLMVTNMRKLAVRSGATLVEVVVVLAIIAVLVGLLVSAIQAARLSAARVSAVNGARQLILATHGYAAKHHDQLLDYEGLPPEGGMSIIRQLCPYLEADIEHLPKFLRLSSDPSGDKAKMSGPQPPIPPPSFGPIAPPEICSFAFNVACYAPGQRLNKTVTDGLSNTLAVSEHYGVCGEATFECHFGGSVQINRDTGRPIPRRSSGYRRTTFADYPMYDDVHPVAAAGGQPATVGSLPLTFQVRPPVADCDPRIPQSSLPGGILAGMLDGSVRFIHPHVSPEVFWGSVTPAGGEVVTLD